MKKYIIISVVFVLISFIVGYFTGKSEPRNYTIRFIDNNNDTTYLFSTCPISYKEAVEIADGYKYKAEPILFNHK